MKAIDLETRYSAHNYVPGWRQAALCRHDELLLAGEPSHGHPRILPALAVVTAQRF